ncbi:MAG: phosphotransferase [Desulfarculus sp.]|nr:phosphotransferase [Desulfarculus sp.]
MKPPHPRIPKHLYENFRFMVLEVSKQVEQTLAFLAEPSPGLLEKIVGRDDYIDSMKGFMEEKSFAHLAAGKSERNVVNLLRCLNTITSNLERIADFAVNVVRQVQYLSDVRFPIRYDYQTCFEEVLGGLGLVVEALGKQDLSLALRICQCEFRLDDHFQSAFRQILDELRKGEGVEDLVTSLFILRYLERMGDSLLNIGEALIFVMVGEKLKIHQYQALTDSLAASGMNQSMAQVEFSSFWGNRSGCKVGSVIDKADKERGRRVVFKEGQRGKIVKEKENIERWLELMPGLPPRIVGFHDQEPQASLLLEYLDGCTFQELVLTGKEDILQNAFYLLGETQMAVWQASRRPQACQARFLRQIRTRLDDILRAHPNFLRPAASLSGLKIASLGQALNSLAEMEGQLPAPFSVFCHGDYNLNNIIYNHKDQCLHYIDLYRSADNDYVQDVSVFLISCFRLPLASSAQRARVTRVALDYLGLARAFAHDQEDDSFEPRLALGLIRSFLTSTRFELREDFAQEMYMRALYLTDRIETHQGRPWARFRVPDDVLVC